MGEAVLQCVPWSRLQCGYSALSDRASVDLISVAQTLTLNGALSDRASVDLILLTASAAPIAPVPPASWDIYRHLSLLEIFLDVYLFSRVSQFN